VEFWNLGLAAVFFIAMGAFTGVAALYLTSTDRTQSEKHHETEGHPGAE
jgi:hypothetical protein